MSLQKNGAEKKLPVPFFSRNIPKEDGKNQTVILVLFALSLLFFGLDKLVPLGKEDAGKGEMLRASEIMAEASNILIKFQKANGVIPDRKSDLNQTGLIGLEFSPITTSIGSLEAKRTTNDPNFAALIVFLLKEAGVKKGETIAVGASGSFPALILAVFSAAKAMDVRPLVICSLGSSQWGANIPSFHWLHIQNCLLEAGTFTAKPIGLSLGGEKDTGKDMSFEGRTLLKKDIIESGIYFFREPDLRKNVEAKMRLYEEKAGHDKIKAFINVGGSWSNMGEDAQVLKLKPGLSKIKMFPPVEKRGILYEMAARKIPVIHLLYIKGLVRKYGLIWDPVPLPKPGEGKIYQLAREKQAAFLFLAALYFLLVILVLFFQRGKLSSFFSFGLVPK